MTRKTLRFSAPAVLAVLALSGVGGSAIAELSGEERRDLRPITNLAGAEATPTASDSHAAVADVTEEAAPAPKPTPAPQPKPVAKPKPGPTPAPVRPTPPA